MFFFLFCLRPDRITKTWQRTVSQSLSQYGSIVWSEDGCKYRSCVEVASYSTHWSLHQEIKGPLLSSASKSQAIPLIQVSIEKCQGHGFLVRWSHKLFRSFKYPLRNARATVFSCVEVTSYFVQSPMRNAGSTLSRALKSQAISFIQAFIKKCRAHGVLIRLSHHPLQPQEPLP